jgi:hypothetical protein
MTEDNPTGFELPILVAANQPDVALIKAAAEERFEIYRKVWSQEFKDIP